MDKKITQKLVDDISRGAAILRKAGHPTDGLDQWIKSMNFSLVDDTKNYFEDRPSAMHPGMGDAAALIFDMAVTQARRYQ